MKQTLILASASPRRRGLLTQFRINHEVCPSKFQEPDPTPNDKPVRYAETVAFEKAREVAKRYPDRVVLAADTIVAIDDLILGKPGSESDACSMIQKLSNRTHEVITGIALIIPGKEAVCDHSVTEVTFRNLHHQEIIWYLKSKDWMDKAGAYGIQSLGGALVSNICGDWYNVVGLPIPLMIALLIRYCPHLWPPDEDGI